MDKKILFCRDCIYQLKPSGAIDKNHPEALCKKNSQLDYVTGENNLIKCKLVNINGLCPDWTIHN
ncbi:MAG: hypothetical protein ACFFG0_05420 [Candidatus Thorarchaeota archaeon]